MTRLKKQKVAVKGKKEFTRFATPEIIADYRAKRLRCNKIADLCCGIGGQTIGFSKTCKEVVAIEVDKEKLDCVPELKNIKKIHGDVLDPKIIEKCNEADIIFCDGERAEFEESRSIDTIKPNVKEIIDKYSKITKKIAIELPPQIKDIPFDCEREYISINGELNRLTIYLNDLKKCNYSVVSLPSGERIEADEIKELKESNTLNYVYEVDNAVVKAGLDFMFGLNLWKKEKNRTYLTSNNLVKNNFFKNIFIVLKSCNKKNVNNELKKLNAKEIILKEGINPKDYWNEKNNYEKNLNGNKRFYLIVVGKDALICEKISS